MEPNGFPTQKTFGITDFHDICRKKKKSTINFYKFCRICLYFEKIKKQMDPLKAYGKICRICLENNVTVNWNEEIEQLCGFSYKDCYYKYTELEADDQGPLPTNLCETCSSGLKNAHLLFEKASASYKFLCETLCTIKEECDVEIGKQQSTTKFEINIIDDYEYSDLFEEDSPKNAMTLVDIDDELLIPAKDYDDDEEDVSTENAVNNSIAEEIPISEDETMKNEDCKNNETSSDQELSESFDSKPAASSTTGNKRKPRNYLCSYCSLVIKGSNYLKIHESTHNEQRKRTETCPQCELKFYTKTALYNHMMIHDKNREKKHKCEFCVKAFFNRGALNVHRRIHLGQMVACKLCPKEFYRQIDLDKHLATHSTSPLHRKAEESKCTVQCQYCNKKIATTKWKTHEAIHLNKPLVKCKICNKDFFARYKVVRHLKNVHGKTLAEYDKFMEYVNEDSRMTRLKMQQKAIVLPISK